MLDPLDALTPQSTGRIVEAPGAVEWKLGRYGLSSIVLSSPVLDGIDPNELDCCVESGPDGPILVCGVGIRGRQAASEVGLGAVAFVQSSRAVWATVALSRVAVAPAVLARLTGCRPFNYREYVAEPQVAAWFAVLAHGTPLESDPRFEQLGVLSNLELLRLSRQVGELREGHPAGTAANNHALRGAVTIELAALLP